MARPASQAAPPPMQTLTRRKMPRECSSARKSGIEKCILVPAAFEISGSYLLLLQELAPAPGKRDEPIDHDIAAVRQVQRVKCVLLHQEHRELLLAIELLDCTEYLARDERRQSQRGLIEQQQARAAHQSTRDRQHLLLAPGERASALIEPFLEPRKQREYPLQVAIEMSGIGERGADLQVLHDRHAHEDAAAFGCLGDLQRGN